MNVISKLKHAKSIQGDDFDFLKGAVEQNHTPKVCIPAPSMLHFRGGRYLQMDDTNLACLCDPEIPRRISVTVFLI